MKGRVDQAVTDDPARPDREVAHSGLHLHAVAATAGHVNVEAQRARATGREVDQRAWVRPRADHAHAVHGAIAGVGHSDDWPARRRRRGRWSNRGCGRDGRHGRPWRGFRLDRRRLRPGSGRPRGADDCRREGGALAFEGADADAHANPPGPGQQQHAPRPTLMAPTLHDARRSAVSVLAGDVLRDATTRGVEGEPSHPRLVDHAARASRVAQPWIELQRAKPMPATEAVDEQDDAPLDPRVRGPDLAPADVALPALRRDGASGGLHSRARGRSHRDDRDEREQAREEQPAGTRHALHRRPALQTFASGSSRDFSGFTLAAACRCATRSCASTVFGAFAPESPGSLQASEIQCVRGDAEHDEHDRRSPRLNVRQAESGRGQTDHRQDPDERSHPALLEHLTDYAMIVRVAQSAGFRHNLGTFAGWWGW